MILVCDATVLILYGRAGRLDVVLRLTEELIVPATVADEVNALPKGDVAIRFLRDHPAVVRPDAELPAVLAAAKLDAGERSVLAWGHRLADAGTPAVLVSDDLAARSYAIEHQLEQLGVVGAARPVLEALVDAGLYATPDLVRQALQLVGERS